MSKTTLRATPRPDDAVESSAPAEAGLFRAHFEHLPAPAYLWARRGGEFVLAAHNRAAAEVPLSRIADLLGVSARELFAEEPLVLADIEATARSGKARSREGEVRYRTGLVRRLELTCIALAPDLVAVHTLDVTERHEAERALRESEQRYRMIVDTAHEGILVTDADSVATLVNGRMAELLGYAPEELVGRSAFELVAEDMVEDARRYSAMLRAGRKAQFDLKLRHRDGSQVWFSVASAPTFDAEGRYRGAVSMLSDITQRRLREAAIRDSEARVRALLDAIPDMVMRIHRSGRYLDVYIAEAICDLLPIPPDDMVGRTAAELFGAEFGAEHERRVLATLESGRTELWEYEFEFKGSVRHVEARFTRIAPEEVVLVCRDNTERVALERELIAVGERERNRIGHDLHDGLAQLLTGIKLLLSSLTDELERAGLPQAAEAREAAELVQLASRQTSELAQGLSPMPQGAKLDDGLVRLAERSRTMFSVACRYVGDRALPDLGEEACGHLYRIAQEAVTNAIRHGRAREIAIDCAVVGRRIVLTVTDDGVGLSTSCEPAVTRGMGLSIMQFRARALGGVLTVAPDPAGGGTVVRCDCPLNLLRV